MWWAVSDCGIDKSLQFGVDEVSVFLEAGRKPRLMYLPKGMAKACRRRNVAPAAVALNQKQRMAHMLCMTTAEGDLAATVVKIADHTVADGKIFLKFVDKGMWVAFINPKVPKSSYSKAIFGELFTASHSPAAKGCRCLFECLYLSCECSWSSEPQESVWFGRSGSTSVAEHRPQAT
jgi:hypothetical protein